MRPPPLVNRRALKTVLKSTVENRYTHSFKPLPNDGEAVPTFLDGGCFAAAHAGGADGADGVRGGFVAEVAHPVRREGQQAQPSAMTAGQFRRSPRADAKRRRWGIERMEWMERVASAHTSWQDGCDNLLAGHDFPNRASRSVIRNGHVAS